MAIRIPGRTEARPYGPASTPGIPRMPFRGSFLQGLARSGRPRLDDQRKERLFRELSLLLRSGVPPRTVLELLVRSNGKGPVVMVVRELQAQVVRGSSLSDAMQQVQAFTEHERQSVRIGEEGGRAADVFEELARYHADRIALRRLLRQAMAYPFFVMVVTLAVVAFMMNVIVPMFAQVFARSGGELPGLTRGVLRMSELFRAGWPWMLLGCGVLAVTGVQAWRTPDARVRMERMIWSVPVLGELQRKSRLARFCRSMAFLLGSGSPLDRALKLSEAMTGSLRMERALRDVRAKVVKGSSLADALACHVEFEPSLVAMIAVAEEVKRMDVMFQRSAERYAEEVKHRTVLLGSVLEPAMIICIAVLVGVVLVAMYLPMFKLSTTM